MCNMQTEMGKVRKHGYICYPGVLFTYGLPYPPRTETVALGTYVGLIFVSVGLLKCVSSLSLD